MSENNATEIDLSAQIGALRVAHDALGRIALMDSGVSGDWAKTALRQMKELLVDEPRPLMLPERRSRYDDAFKAREDELERATGETRR